MCDDPPDKSSSGMSSGAQGSDAELGFEVLYEEGHCLVVNKPAGVATQAPPGIDSLEIRIRRFLAERPGAPERVYLGIPHRLDRPASGVMVFATNRRAAQRLSKQFERRQVKKIYWACVAGVPEPGQGTWQDHLRKVYGHPLAEVVAADHPEGRLAVLHYRTLATADGHSWLEIELETGRTHQIRIQAASRGHPLLGDMQYGSTVSFGPQHEDERLRAIALHARSLAFQHPMTRQVVCVTAPLPNYWPARRTAKS
jgi:RluA family pseudouridine synthase